MKNRIYKVSIIFLKYAPVISALIMMLHTALLISHKALIVADWSVSLPILPTLVAIIWSKTFGFCRLHRHFILYSCLVSYCIKIQDTFGFGNYLNIARIIVLIIGILLFICMFIKLVKKYREDILNMMSVIKSLLIKIIDDIDAGNSNLTEDEEIEVVKLLKKYTKKDKPLSKSQAYTYLNISRATFDNLVKSGKLPQGKKQQGFKELHWFKKDLDKYIKNK